MSLEDLLENIFGQSAQRSGRRRRGPQLPPDLLPVGSGETDSAADDDQQGVRGIMRGVVQVVALKSQFLGGMASAWTGSGSIVHPSGVILTNCRVANPRAMGMPSPAADRLGIAVTQRSDQPPAVTYFAEIVAQNPELDLAVLRIVGDVHGRHPQGLKLPTIPLGDSDRLDLGDPLAIIGYPGIGGETVTYTSGNVSGFSKQGRLARGWIKTDATIAGGNSGGTAVNQAGQLVGVPTQAAAGAGITPVDARPVLDTNRDGRVDQRDTPMAIGGFINGLRPINLAIPLLEEAGVDVTAARAAATANASVLPSGGISRAAMPQAEATFTNLSFSTQVTDDNRPVHPSTRIPTGVDTMYATFEHQSIKTGTPWSVVWMAGDNVIIDQRDQWDEAEFGRKSVKISNRRGLPAGEYRLLLGIDDKVALEGSVQVGRAVDDTDSEVSGKVVDRRTGRGIDAALVIVLRPEASLHDFLRHRHESAIFSSDRTDANGEFTLPKQLPKGQAYSLIVAARGYEPLAVERALRVSEDAPEHANVGSLELDEV